VELKPRCEAPINEKFERRALKRATVLLIPDATRNARAAILRKFRNLHIVGSRYVIGMITVNSLIYDIPCIISRDLMRHEFRPEN